MSCPGFLSPITKHTNLFRFLLIPLATLTMLLGAQITRAQAYSRQFDTSDKPSISIINRNGRVSVIASDEQQKQVSLEARSPGSPVDPTDITADAKGGRIEIDVRARSDKDRIDLIVRVPSRSKIDIESEAGSVDVVGNIESASVKTNTGTIHADVPLEAVKYEFLWTASKPRFMSDVELPEVKEKARGEFKLSGRLGDKKAEKEVRVALNFLTQRGVVLLNVDPSMAPSDLRERPLTEAAKSIVRSGNSELVDAIRKVSPKTFGDYSRTLPTLEKEPTLRGRTSPGPIVSVVAPQLKRFNASVLDKFGRAIGGMRETDFTVFENGVERHITNVIATNEPFNLVLLLDVSGSVEERMDFIRKAARDFLRTASPQDRIAILSFRDDIQVISNFTTDRQLLSRKLDEIDAGGGTALYDALGYVLAEMIKQLRGERTAVVVMSDGDDNKSFLPFPAILEALRESGVLIYPLYVPSGLIPESSVPRAEVTIDPTRTRYLTLTSRAEDEGRKLAAASGGVYYPIRRIEDLQKAYDDVVLQLRTAYTITYASNSISATPPRLSVRTNRDGASVRLSPAIGVNTP